MLGKSLWGCLFSKMSAMECALMELSRLTILSIPLGPRDVLTTSATAASKHKVKIWSRLTDKRLVTFGSDDVGKTDVFGLFRAESGSLVVVVGCHLNLEICLML